LATATKDLTGRKGRLDLIVTRWCLFGWV